MEAQRKQQDLFVKQREQLFSEVQRTYNAFQKLQPPQVLSAKPRYDRLIQTQAGFQAIQSNILELNADLIAPNKPLEIEKVQESFETVLYAAQGQYLELLHQFELSRISAHVSPVVSPPVTMVNTLPTIDIPKFDGNMNHWTEYYSLFTSLIHENDSLNNIQKFHYLRSTLTGTALSVITGLPLVKENYILALNALINRYQSPRLLAALHMNQILDFSPLKSSSHSGLQNFLQVHKNNVDALIALDMDNLSDYLLFSLTLKNLDLGSRKAFENKHSSRSTPTYASLIQFIEEQSRTMELCGLDHCASVSKAPPSPPRKMNSLIAMRQARSAPHSSRPPVMASQTSCPLCQQGHTIYRCPIFIAQSAEERYATVRNLQRCFNCIGTHMRHKCTSKSVCSTCCSNLHHTLLHPSSTQPLARSLTANSSPLRTLACQVQASNSTHQTVLLGTINALIQDCQGQYQPLRAVLDCGSQVSAVSHSLIRKLGLKISPSHSQLVGIGNASAQVYGTVQCSIASRHNPDIPLSVQALVLSAISNPLPTSPVPLDVYERFRGLSLADSRFDVPSQIDFLIGADLYPDILKKSGDLVIRGNPSALSTIFGWVILGPVHHGQVSTEPPLSLLACSSTPLDHALRLFWESEEIHRPPQLDPDDQLCEEHFVATHQRDSSGRYSVALPFKPSSTPLGTNRDAILRNFLGLERRLKRQPEHDAAYQAFMQDYVESGHMTPALTPSTYVIPHHCVHKTTSSSTKLRVVFNASSPDGNGVTLNQHLMSGPKLQGELPGILIAFRIHAIAICADIRQMYRQILVHPSDRKFQHIFWRPTPTSPVMDYELNTVTYGLTPSAFLAQRVLRQLIHDDGELFPLASDALNDHTYIDDIVSGTNNLAEAQELQRQLVSLLSRGGFELRKWSSNNPDALKTLPVEHLETPIVFSTEDHNIKILGLLWDPRTDDFSFHTQPFDGVVTKRSALSYIARIFDPLGFLTPFVCWMKIFMQQLWLSQTPWDEPLADQLSHCWLTAMSEVSVLTSFRVPRALPNVHGVNRLIGFCDASERGYAAVIYLHTSTHSSSHVNLLRARSKVAPVKPMTIPRLELSAAVLLSRLLKDISSSLSTLAVDSVVLYTDSSIVLAWLVTPPHRLKTFVANRVVEILETSTPTDWRHVASADNPADCASRGILPTQLLEHPLWLNGPRFLLSSPYTWPRSSPPLEPLEEMPEMKTTTTTLVARVSIEPLLIELQKFSSLLRAQRVFGHVVRFARILLAQRSQAPRPSGPLLPGELQDALDLLIKITQHHHYSVEIHQLTHQKQVDSRLASLSPFLDSSGFLRVGGRLRHASLPLNARHPLLLPKEALFPGRDGVPRVASIRSASGVFSRPVNKLVTLPSA